MATSDQESQPDNLDAALTAFAGVLGRENVLTDAVGLREFRDPYWVKSSADFDAAASVKPRTVEQVQAVVRIANEHRIRLWTIGQGRNNTYGGPAPTIPGAVIVNLREMNRVLEIDTELAYAVVEPGVRWFDLADALRDAGGGLWPSIPDLGWGSVVGNTLEYGRGYTPYGDHASSVCGMEVVLPTGEVLRTGMGAMTGSKAWHVYQHSFGPQVDGLFMQSSLGIVTSMGVWLMPRPEVYVSAYAFFDGDATVPAVVDALRELMLDGTVRNYPLMGRGITVDGVDGVPVIDPSSDRWMVRFALYGRAEIVEAQYRVVEKMLTAIPGVATDRRSFKGSDRVTPDNHDDRVQCGIPDMDLMDLFKTPYGEDTGHLDFSPVGPLRGNEVLSTVKLVRSLFDRHGHPYLGGLLLAPRSVIHVCTTFFDPNDEAQTRRVYAVYDEMVRELALVGYPLYRTNIHHMDLVAEQFDFNNHVLRRFNETIKDALDPNGILQPGKQGIWPAALRGRVPSRR